MEVCGDIVLCPCMLLPFRVWSHEGSSWSLKAWQRRQLKKVRSLACWVVHTRVNHASASVHLLCVNGVALL